MNIVIILAIAVVVLAVWWRFIYVPRPAVAPLILPPDDPLMLAAHTRAKETIPRFRVLITRPNRGVRVKVPFVSSSGTTEFLWADLLGLEGAEMRVRYLTPPITHTGRLERLHSYPVADLVDWLVEDSSGQYHGGFSMRAMFTRGREQWGTLPPKLQREERKYGPDVDDGYA